MHPLIRKLRSFMDLSDTEATLLTFPGNGQRAIACGADLVAYGERMSRAVLLEDGWAIRHRTLSDGRRQILGFVLPGDFCDPSAFVEERAHASVTAITPVRATYVSERDVYALVHRAPRLSTALWWQCAYEQASTRAHVFALGRFSAYERLAYLLQELTTRLGLIGRTQTGSFEFPGTQQHLADTLGMTHVHVSRTLSRLAADGVVTKRGARDLVVNISGLRAVLELGSACTFMRNRASSRLWPDSPIALAQ